MNPFENLVNAIILKAVSDYRHALRKCNQHPERDFFQQEILSTERFFRSAWFGFLTNLDPEVLIRKLRKEVEQDVV